MTYEVVVETVKATPLAAVRRQVQPGAVATAWRPALDLVWTFVRQEEGLWTGGHNVFVYHHANGRDDPMTVEFGVQVARSFVGNGIVEPTETPAGRVASTRHLGPVDGLRDAHQAIEAWRASHGEVFGGISWETYGDWGSDPATWETWVTYLLA
jgi:effector-binding domain-containing protein